ncbi:MAG: class I SAM-dependent methyltransferase [Candidatus Omnitrophica bacterium]|nr:class I SAM-dependent methyltransferase [Candidatus Omnitrophota bacterium]
MSINDQQINNIVENFATYLNKLCPAQDDKLIKIFLNSFRNYVVFFGRIIPLIEQPGHVYDIRIQNQLNFETDKFLLAAEKLEKSLPLSARVKVRDYFRKIAGKYLFQSQILKRFYDKPRGYAGDYFMFEMMYDGKPLSDGIGVYFDYYVFYHSLVVSVINRKEKMKKILKNILDKKLKNNSLIKILNIGCGGARDVKELFNENTFSGRVAFTLMDQDEEGLSYAKSKLRSLKKENVKFNFIQKNALEMMGFSKRLTDKEHYDLIYTLGIVDYFLNNAFVRFIKHSYSMLKPDGKLIIAVCSNRNMKCYTALKWLSEWNFYYRGANSVRKLIDEAIDEDANVEISWEKKKQVFFIVITKIY